MGGFGALVIAFKHPDMFAAVAAHSAAVFEELPRAPSSASDMRGSHRYRIATQIFGSPPDAAFFNANNPLGVGAANAGRLGSLKVYFDVGTEDRYGFAAGNQRLHEVLEKAGVAHEYHAVGGDHGFSFLLSRADQAFRFLWTAIK
jgi:S-formylglutathione hydrolase FrmB